ncbi:unnamed protein product [Durusdinium trenchii]|uniref:Uncharacterized protein n=1 Tax=Durusdinium trenchii TaxID=1381693 RepID=A0ABP0IIZ1_9DINO
MVVVIVLVLVTLVLVVADAPSAEEEVEAVAGKGPAMESVSYDGYILKGPKATRPERLPGAAKPAPESLASKEMFDPTTFVPREKDIHPYLKPGLVPWLVILWWISGVLILLQASGWKALRVAPLIRDSEEGPQPIEQGAAFLWLELEESRTSTSQPLLGEKIETTWPSGAFPRRLACATDGANVMLAAASRFGLFQAAMSLSDAWLGEGDAAAGTQHCAYAETTSGRLVELKSGLGGSGRPDWLPTRVLMADTHKAMRRGGDLHILGDRYLGMLGADGAELRAFDVQNSGAK